MTFAGLFLLGCPPTYPKCENDSHCKEHNEVCVQGQCAECAVDKNCPANFVCQANKCVPKPECTPQSGCGEGKKCENGKCVVAEAPPPANPCASCGPDEVCQDGACVRRSAGTVADCKLSPIRFGFNEATLTAEGRQALSTAADCLKATRGKIVVEGHADERGTEEYNLQLSQRRAETVKKYLGDLGVSASAMQTVGYGEERPVSSESTEEGWAANRRVELRD
jgi:peptidoglycan-associated lipoprotein